MREMTTIVCLLLPGRETKIDAYLFYFPLLRKIYKIGIDFNKKMYYNIYV